MSKEKSDSHLGAWLMVDEKNKRVEYQVDSQWHKNASDEEQKITLEKLTRVAGVYQRAGYAIIDLIKKNF